MSCTAKDTNRGGTRQKCIWLEYARAADTTVIESVKLSYETSFWINIDTIDTTQLSEEAD